MKRKVYLRADTGNGIGYGHFIRSLALAAMLREDFDCTLFSAAPNDFQREQAEGVCALAALPSDDSRHALFLEGLHGDEIVVLDNYFFSENYVAAIQAKGCKVVRIQDFFGEKSRADAIVYPCRNTSRALLRQPFLSPDDTAAHRKGRWVLAFGGTDPLGLGARFSLESDRMGLEHTILTGGLGAQKVAELFRDAEGVICSASSVCYEALACGCKVCAGWYVDNQQDFYNELCSKGLILPLGDLRTASLPMNLSEAPSSPSIAEQFRHAPRFYRSLFHSLEMEVVNYTDLTAEQSREVWTLRNDERIRRWMTNPDSFSFESHSRFINSLRERIDKEYYAFYLNGILAGSFDFIDISADGSAEGGLFVNPNVQGQGIASQILARMDTRAYNLGLKTLTAEILADNERSLRLHCSAGYEVESEKDGMLYLKRNL